MYQIKASPGDALLRKIANARALPIELLRTAFIRFRVTTLSTTNASLTDTQRANPDYDFLWERLIGYVQPLAADTTVQSQHAFVNIALSGGNFNLFDQNLMMAHLCPSSANGTTPEAPVGALSGLEFPIPMVIPAGAEMVATFSAETGFSASNKVAEVLLLGTYVHKDLEVATTDGLSAQDLVRLAKILTNAK